MVCWFALGKQRTPLYTGFLGGRFSGALRRKQLSYHSPCIVPSRHESFNSTNRCMYVCVYKYTCMMWLFAQLNSGPKAGAHHTLSAFSIDT